MNTKYKIQNTRYKALTPLDSESAVTVFKSVCITRSNPREELTSVDLENLLAQALWRSFDQLRNNAAARLRVNEVDLLLTDARVTGIKIDGHQVINPEGFTGGEIELQICLTIVRRDKFPEKGGIVFEEGSVRAYLTAAKTKKAEIIYADSGNDITTVFRVTPDITSYIGEFKWGRNDVVKAFATAFEADTKLGNALYLQYVANEISLQLMKKFDKIFFGSFGTFVNGLTMAIRNYIAPRLTESGSRTYKRVSSARRLPIVYVRSFALPGAVWNKSFTVGDHKVKFVPAPDVDLQEFVDGNQCGVYGELNQLAKRRIKWLMPNNESK
jgi:hypothetical protein